VNAQLIDSSAPAAAAAADVSVDELIIIADAAAEA